MTRADQGDGGGILEKMRQCRIVSRGCTQSIFKRNLTIRDRFYRELPASAMTFLSRRILLDVRGSPGHSRTKRQISILMAQLYVPDIYQTLKSSCSQLFSV